MTKPENRRNRVTAQWDRKCGSPSSRNRRRNTVCGAGSSDGGANSKVASANQSAISSAIGMTPIASFAMLARTAVMSSLR